MVPTRPPNPSAPGVRAIGPGGVYQTLRPIPGVTAPWVPPDPVTLQTIRYVRKTGSDSNGGTSSSDAWLTINKALTTVSAGTVIYVGAGTYREVLLPTVTPTAALPVAVIGDVDGSFTGDAGMVQLTAYLTDDLTTPSSSVLLDLNGKSNLTFQNLFMVSGNANVIDGATHLSSQNIVFRDCAFHQGFVVNNVIVRIANSTGVQPLNWRFERCDFGASVNASGVTITLASQTGPDYDAGVIFNNCRFMGSGLSRFVLISKGGALAGLGGGVHLRNCSAFHGATLLQISSLASSLQIPSSVTGCFIFNMNAAALAGGTLGQLFEDYNLIFGTAPSTCLSGGHSKSDGHTSPLFHFGQEKNWGGQQRAYGEPMAGSPLLAFGAAVAAPGLLDYRSAPRPGTQSRWAVGCFERTSGFTKETGTTHTGSNAISITGAGSHDFDLAVDAAPITVSVFCQRDTNYTGPPPQLQVLANEEIDVGTNNADGSPAGVSAFEQLAVTISPTAKGVVTVRVIANDSSGAGKTIFDTFAAA